METDQLPGDGGQVGEVLVDDFPQLGMADAKRAADHHQHTRDGRVEETGAQYALSDHAGRAEDDDFHGQTPGRG